MAGLGDAPIEDKYREQMQRLAQTLDEILNPDQTKNKETGFCLMMFDFGDGPGHCNYISNANRADVVTLLKEQLARFEGQPEVTGRD